MKKRLIGYFIGTLAVLGVLLATRGLYMDVMEWSFILIVCVGGSFIVGLRVYNRQKKFPVIPVLVTAIGIYFVLTLFDTVVDYYIVQMSSAGNVDGMIPPLGKEVLPETYDGFGLLNIAAPALVGCISIALLALKNRRICG